MIEGLAIVQVKTDKEWGDLLPLYQSDASESGFPIPEDLELQKTIYDAWIAKLSGKSIGFAAGMVFNIGRLNDTYSSRRIYVAPDFRNRGVGSELKRAQIDFARSKGYRALEAVIPYHNSASKRVHEKTGFVLSEDGYGRCYIATLLLGRKTAADKARLRLNNLSDNKF